MIDLTPPVTQILSALTLLGDVFIVFFIGGWFLFRQSKFFTRTVDFLNQKGLILAFVISIMATSGSLFFSEVAGYEPCKLCWFQRIFMYPQVLILGTALWLNDRKVYRYIIPLALTGAIVAAYHEYLQLGGSPLIPCSAADYSLNCAKRFILEFGYVTVPVMSFTTFALNLIIMKIIKKSYQ